jgi:putative transposase
MRAVIHRKVYRFKLRPTKSQREKLVMMAGARRFLWNWALERRNSQYKLTGKGLSYAKQNLELTRLKKQADTAWLKEVDSQASQEALRDLDKAFRRWFKYLVAKKRGEKVPFVGYPKFKSKKSDTLRFRIPQRVHLENNRVYLPKVGYIKLHLSQQVQEAIKSATFKRTHTGEWFVTLLTEFELPDVALPNVNPEHVVGIDFGLKDFVTLSDNFKQSAPRFFRKQERKLARSQRKLSRRMKGSANREKARRLVARVHERTVNQRANFLHKLSSDLTRNYQALCVETLNLKGLTRTKLAKSFSDAALGEFKRQLEYKTLWQRKHLVSLPPFYPGSKTCHVCGEINHHLTLEDRAWTCRCGTHHDRDLNAALNHRNEGLKRLEAAGYTDSLNACGADVRLAPREPFASKQESPA